VVVEKVSLYKKAHPNLPKGKEQKIKEL